MFFMSPERFMTLAPPMKKSRPESARGSESTTFFPITILEDEYSAREFLSLSKTQAIRVVVAYRNHLLDSSLAPATINRRISAIKSLVEMEQIFGICDYDLEVIKNEKVRPVRDTKGIDVPEVMRVI
jgi:hypothetical protein